MMDGLAIVSKIQKLMKDRLQAVGDTMMIVGYINDIAWDYLYFILE